MVLRISEDRGEMINLFATTKSFMLKQRLTEVIFTPQYQGPLLNNLIVTFKENRLISQNPGDFPLFYEMCSFLGAENQQEGEKDNLIHNLKMLAEKGYLNLNYSYDNQRLIDYFWAVIIELWLQGRQGEKKLISLATFFVETAKAQDRQKVLLPGMISAVDNMRPTLDHFLEYLSEVQGTAPSLEIENFFSKYFTAEELLYKPSYVNNNYTVFAYLLRNIDERALERVNKLLPRPLDNQKKVDLLMASFAMLIPQVLDLMVRGNQNIELNDIDKMLDAFFYLLLTFQKEGGLITFELLEKELEPFEFIWVDLFLKVFSKKISQYKQGNSSLSSIWPSIKNDISSPEMKSFLEDLSKGLIKKKNEPIIRTTLGMFHINMARIEDEKIWQNVVSSYSAAEQIVILKDNIDILLQKAAADYNGEAFFLQDMYFQAANILIGYLELDSTKKDIGEPEIRELKKQMALALCEYFIRHEEVTIILVDGQAIANVKKSFQFVYKNMPLFSSAEEKVKLSLMLYQCVSRYHFIKHISTSSPDAFLILLMEQTVLFKLLQGVDEADEVYKDVVDLLKIKITFFLLEKKAKVIGQMAAQDRSNQIIDFLSFIQKLYADSILIEAITDSEVISAISYAKETLAKYPNEKLGQAVADFLMVLKEAYPFLRTIPSELQKNMMELEAVWALVYGKKEEAVPAIENLSLNVVEDKPVKKAAPQKNKGKEKEKEKAKIIMASYEKHKQETSSSKETNTSLTDNQREANTPILANPVALYAKRFAFPASKKQLIREESLAVESKEKPEKNKKEKDVVRMPEKPLAETSIVEKHIAEITETFSFLIAEDQIVLPLVYMGEQGVYYGLIDKNCKKMQEFFKEFEALAAEKIFTNNFEKAILQFGEVKNGLSLSRRYGPRVKVTHEILGEYRVSGVDFVQNGKNHWHLLVFQTPQNHKEQEHTKDTHAIIDITNMPNEELKTFYHQEIGGARSAANFRL